MRLENCILVTSNNESSDWTGYRLWLVDLVILILDE